MYPYESFIVWLFICLFAFLGICFVLTSIFIIRKNGVPFGRRSRKNDIPALKKSYKPIVQGKPKPAQPAFKKPEEEADLFRSKLGDKVVQYMIEVAQCDSLDIVKDRMERIREECERLNGLPLPQDSKEIISTVFLWAKKFNIERHLSEMKVYQQSSQIAYDFKKHDFKLRISGD